MGVPAPIPGLSVLHGAYGKLFGDTPVFGAGGDAEATLTAVIPALNEERTIATAIASLDNQTVTPDELVVVDDGSTDATAAIVEDMATQVSYPIRLLQHDEPRGKTPSIKEVARNATSELLFVLDADTYLESETYLERVREAHTESDVACAFGEVQPITQPAARSFHRDVVAERLPEESVAREMAPKSQPEGLRSSLRYWLTRWPVEQYRSVLYDIEQGFAKDASMRLYGTALFPAGCGVLYNRAALVDVFDRYESSLGDNLTNSEDIFLGYAFVDEGLSNVQVSDVRMRTAEPSVGTLTSQLYLWGSAYLQSAYYFRKSLVRLRRRKANEADGTRPPPIGRVIVAQLVDGLYSVGLLVLLVAVVLHVASLEWLVLLLAFEYGLYTGIATACSSKRLRTIRQALLSAPVRFLSFPIAAYTYARVGSDILRRNRDWRK